MGQNHSISNFSQKTKLWNSIFAPDHIKIRGYVQAWHRQILARNLNYKNVIWIDIFLTNDSKKFCVGDVCVDDKIF